MGNLPSGIRSRLQIHRQVAMDQDDNTSTPTDDTNLSYADEESTMDFATILSFLLRSGQVRLVRNGGSGNAFEINLEGDENDSDNDDEFWGRSTRNVSPPPQTLPPDTTNMKENRLKGIIERDGGYNVRYPLNIANRILQREKLSLKRRYNFEAADKAVISSHFLPNSFETMARFRSKVFCGTYSSDGSLFLSACQDQHLRLYDTQHGQFRLFREIVAKDFGWSIVDTAYSPDQHYIIYSSWSEFIHLCNVYGDYETHIALDLRPEEARFCAFSISFSMDSQEIIAGGSDKCLYIYDRSCENRTLRISAHDDDVNSVCFADSSSKILFSASDDGLCKVWDRRTLNESDPKPVGTFAGHADGLTYVCAKGDGTYLLTNSKDQTVKLWDCRKFSADNTIREARKRSANQRWDYRWEQIPQRTHHMTRLLGNDAVMTYRGHSVLHTLLRAKFSPSHTTGQKYIYTGCASGSVVVYDVLTGNVVTKLKGHRQCVRDVSWHPYENTIISSSWDRTIGRFSYFNKSCDKEKECDKARKQKTENESARLRRRRRYEET